MRTPVILALSCFACAAEPPAVALHQGFATGELGAWDDGAGLAAAAAPFGLTPEALVPRARAGGEGRHRRFRQVVDGLDVVGGELVVHLDEAGAIVGVNGTARADLAPAQVPDGARAAALAAVRADPDRAALAVHGARLVHLITEDGARYLAHEVTVGGADAATDEPVLDHVYVDTATAAIVAVYPQIHAALNRRVYTARNLTTLPGVQRRTEGQAATTDVDVNAAYDNTGHFYNAHLGFFARDSYDNAGATISSSVHYGRNFCNALWNGNQMIFGDGSGTCRPLARSLDVTGHELTHAVTRAESQLVYSGESGGMNEALSDIFGAFVEAWADGGGTGELAISDSTWLIGEDVFPTALRNMCDPASDTRSADFWTTNTKNLNVHYSSGIGELAFCLLARGGTHPRGRSTIVVPAIGFDAAIRIFYTAQVDVLTSTSTYANTRLALEQAAGLLGNDQATIDAVGCAFAAVGVGSAPAACD
jgi:vibriolysin